MSRTWSAVLARLGVPTGDGRIIAPGAGSSRDLPLPLAWQELSGDGHGGSMVVSRIETLHIGDGMVTATGTMLDSAPAAVIEQLEAGLLGPSVDLDDIEYTMDDQERLVITRWRVAGATLVAIPAFADVSLTLDPLPVEPVDDVMRGPDGREMDDNGTGPKWLEGYEILASARPEPLPPLDWFRKPDLDRLTPLTVSDTGRVFGHIAGWGQCHVGLPGCVTPPSSPSGYAHFHQDSQPTAEGVELPVGVLVAGPRHADPQAGFLAAQQHYDDPDARVAKVMAGEDEYGIWVAGWILPDATERAVQIFRSSPVSGDWRRRGGALELIAVCSVNVPGFPVPRARVAFSNGAQRTLIGTFGITPVSGEWADAVAPDASFVKTAGEEARARWAWAQTGTE